MTAFPQPSSKQKKIYTATLLLSLAAVVVTIFLLEAHFKPSEGGSFCNINDYWNCDRVNKSIFAEIFGIPMSVLGFGFYTFFSLTLFGLIKNFNFSKYLHKIGFSNILKITLAGTLLASLCLMFYETTILGNLAYIGIIKAIIFITTYIATFKFAQKHDRPVVYFMAFLQLLTLFGMDFTLYLTNVEFFVLEAVCIFCITQQILLAIITGFTTKALLNSPNEHTA
ncbi:hypothetical protein IT412_02610 [Candidatus Peregrinibacteria bacterium]|nr:hypothetical protein [Candidatus Peregrinibacteria bacterium]